MRDQRPFYARRATQSEIEHRLEWERLLDAGLIGNRIPPTPEQLARLAHNDAIFRARAARHREALR
ncbi:hypothetical protein [Sphingomonas jatrophae]|uniref:Uncharacterized protein n=1 Tax=Sphingomonas jatrophae TaxID=1166337 RepID=A0A1I6LAM4_9SPHN|nr:hypothetical protein [Sphingomonas jatrophae]SFS00535.1 hypothetical protein SAMN05192580_2517 [Sphingomonas jatrophae]